MALREEDEKALDELSKFATHYKMDGTLYPQTREGFIEWVKDFENIELRRISETTLWWGGWISTVWLGLDHGWSGGKPVIFETMLFPSNEMDRYCTPKEAKEGHEAFVKRYRWRFWYRWK